MKIPSQVSHRASMDISPRDGSDITKQRQISLENLVGKDNINFFSSIPVTREQNRSYEAKSLFVFIVVTKKRKNSIPPVYADLDYSSLDQVFANNRNQHEDLPTATKLTLREYRAKKLTFITLSPPVHYRCSLVPSMKS